MATAQARGAAKKRLRSQVKENLARLSEGQVTSQSRKAQQVILDLKQYRHANRIGIYLSMPKAEAQTDLLVRDALRSGKQVYVPYIYSIGTEKPKKKMMEMLQLRSLEEYEGLSKDSWGIPKLATEDLECRGNAMGGVGTLLGHDGNVRDDQNGATTSSLDVIVVPGVGFDREMNRIGHGAAFYDTFLTRFFASGNRTTPFLVGMCLTEQILPSDQLLMEEWDWKVHAVAVGDGTLLT